MENMILSATYSYAVDGIVYCIMTTHVDDLLWANDPSIDPLIVEILKELIPGDEGDTSFKFCGVEITQ